METNTHQDWTRCDTRRAVLARCAAALLPFAALLGTSTPARAVDGCQVLLCFAAADWRSIPQCVPPVQQALHDVARGKPFPRCAMAGAGNSAESEWAQAPSFCPPQYTRLIEFGDHTRAVCDFTGAVSVTVNGAPYARTWWSLTGDTVTEFAPAAKATLGQWNTRFDADLAAWQASQAAEAVAAVGVEAP